MRRVTAQGEDRRRPDQLDLAHEIGLAGGHLVGLGIGVPRRAALQDIGDKDLVTPETDRLQDLGQELARGSHERLASLVLVTEMFREAEQIATASGEFMTLYVEAAVLYWVICLILSAGQSVLEKRLDRYVAH